MAAMCEDFKQVNSQVRNNLFSEILYQLLWHANIAFISCKHSNLIHCLENLLSVGSGAFLGPRIIICLPTLQEFWILNIGLPKVGFI